jgi:hypothetical protein
MQPPQDLRARFAEADGTAKDSRIPDGIRKWEDDNSVAVTLPSPVLLPAKFVDLSVQSQIGNCRPPEPNCLDWS